MMDKKLERYYEARFDMMASEGWKDLIEDIQAMLVSTNSLDNVDSVEKLHFKRGEISIMKWIIGLKDISEKAFEDLKNEQEII